MRIGSLFLVFMFALVAVAGAAPSADSQSNFHDPTWPYWTVVDRTLLNVRGGAQLDTLLKTPRARWPKVDPNTWSVEGRLPPGYVVQAKSVQGSILLTDVRGNPWIIADIGRGGVGVVRASSPFVNPAFQEPPRPDDQGNYHPRTLHLYWLVVDPDSAGLNIRLHPRYPKVYDDIDAVFPKGPVASWPVVGAVRRGTMLKAAMGNVGVVSQRDEDGATWLLVHRPEGGLGFVRWRRDFVQPAAGPLLAP